MAKPKGATPRKASSSLSFFAAMLVGMILTVGIGLFVYLWNPFNQGKTSSTDEAPMVQPKVQERAKPTNYEFYDLLKEQQVSGVPDQAIASQPLSAQPDVVLTQVDSQSASQKNNVSVVDNPLLSDDNGTAPRAIAAGEDNPSTDNPSADKQAADGIVITNETATRTYILQINSFNNAEDADKRRAEVLMAGVDAQIVKKRLSNEQTVYQVISRPMSTPQMAAEAQRQLLNSRIDSLIVEQRREH